MLVSFPRAMTGLSLTRLLPGPLDRAEDRLRCVCVESSDHKYETISSLVTLLLSLLARVLSPYSLCPDGETDVVHPRQTLQEEAHGLVLDDQSQLWLTRPRRLCRDAGSIPTVIFSLQERGSEYRTRK